VTAEFAATIASMKARRIRALVSHKGRSILEGYFNQVEFGE
jgi:hypothetical protein